MKNKAIHFIMKKFLYLFIVLFKFTYSQSTFNTFIFDDSLDLRCKRVLETNDEAYIINCSTNLNTDFTVNRKTRLLKLDINGNLLWDKMFKETSSSEFFGKTVNAFDGGYLMADESYSYTIADEDTLTDILVRKIDVNGNIEWQKIYPARSFKDIIQTSDSSYLLLGQVHEQNGYISADAIVYKIDINGDIIWKNRYGVKKNEWPYVRETTHNIYEIDNNIYFTGLFTKSDSSTYLNGFIYKIDLDGNFNWVLYDKTSSIFIRKHILSVFKFKNKLYFNSLLDNRLYEINDLDGTFEYTNKQLNISYTNFYSNYRKDYDITCNEITTIHLKDSFWVLDKYNELDNIYYSKVIKKIDYNQSNSSIGNFHKTKDGGYVFLRGGTKYNEYLITKTDCLGNDSFWSTDCNLKLKEENNIIIYPNPTNEILNLETNYKIINTEIINPLGQTINYKNYCNCNKQTINIEQLPKGNYYIKVNGKENQDITKFIKY